MHVVQRKGTNPEPAVPRCAVNLTWTMRSMNRDLDTRRGNGEALGEDGIKTGYVCSTAIFSLIPRVRENGTHRDKPTDRATD